MRLLAGRWGQDQRSSVYSSARRQTLIWCIHVYSVLPQRAWHCKVLSVVCSLAIGVNGGKAACFSLSEGVTLVKIVWAFAAHTAGCNSVCSASASSAAAVHREGGRMLPGRASKEGVCASIAQQLKQQLKVHKERQQRVTKTTATLQALSAATPVHSAHPLASRLV